MNWKRHTLLGLFRGCAGVTFLTLTLPIWHYWSKWFSIPFCMLIGALAVLVITEKWFTDMCSVGQTESGALQKHLEAMKKDTSTMDEINKLASLGKTATDALVPCARVLHWILLKEKTHEVVMPDELTKEAWAVLNASKKATLEYVMASGKSTLFPANEEVQKIAKNLEDGIEKLSGQGRGAPWDIL